MQTQITMFNTDAIALMQAYEARSGELLSVLAQGNVTHHLSRIKRYLDQHGAQKCYPWDAVIEPSPTPDSVNDNDAPMSSNDVLTAVREGLTRDAAYHADVEHLRELHNAANDFMLSYISAIIVPDKSALKLVQKGMDRLKGALVEHAGLGVQQANLVARQFKNTMEAIGNDVLGPAYPVEKGR